MSDIVDLDALLPEAVIVKFDGQEIQIPPPTTADVIRLGSLAGKLENADKLNASELETIISSITTQIYKCVPALDGKPFASAQLLKLVSIISQMAVPKESQELAARGITSDTPKTNP